MNAESSIDPPGARWRTSSFSGGGGSNCVQVADLGPVVAVRDSKDPQGPVLTFSKPAWARFTAKDPGSSVRVTVTADTSVAPHKPGEATLHVMSDAAEPAERLYFSAAEWDAFLLGVDNREFDLTVG
jgi:Domain of unknown function (DUF397)